MAATKKPKKLKYEDQSLEIDAEIKKRRGKWFLDSLAWFDFEDVEQIIRAHIYRKWDQWDQIRPLRPWVNKIITNQMKNILRNNYSNFVRPCLGCPFNQSGPAKEGASGSLCGFTSSGMQDSSCPLYAKWERTKKSAYDIKMALTLENHCHEVHAMHDLSFNIEESQDRLNVYMEKILSAKQFTVYKLLYIENKDEEAVAQVMGYKTSEKGRKAGYKQIKNLKKVFKQKAQEILETEDIISVRTAPPWI
jgi:DNA-directed RNA polymerase specialized sigma24 family protein